MRVRRGSGAFADALTRLCEGRRKSVFTSKAPRFTSPKLWLAACSFLMLLWASPFWFVQSAIHFHRSIPDNRACVLSSLLPTTHPHEKKKLNAPYKTEGITSHLSLFCIGVCKTSRPTTTHASTLQALTPSPPFPSSICALQTHMRVTLCRACIESEGCWVRRGDERTG